MCVCVCAPFVLILFIFKKNCRLWTALIDSYFLSLLMLGILMFVYMYTFPYEFLFETGSINMVMSLYWPC